MTPWKDYCQNYQYFSCSYHCTVQIMHEIFCSLQYWNFFNVVYANCFFMQMINCCFVTLHYRSNCQQCRNSCTLLSKFVKCIQNNMYRKCQYNDYKQLQALLYTLCVSMCRYIMQIWPLLHACKQLAIPLVFTVEVTFTNIM